MQCIALFHTGSCIERTCLSLSIKVRGGKEWIHVHVGFKHTSTWHQFPDFAYSQSFGTSMSLFDEVCHNAWYTLSIGADGFSVIDHVPHMLSAIQQTLYDGSGMVRLTAITCVSQVYQLQPASVLKQSMLNTRSFAFSIFRSVYRVCYTLDLSLFYRGICRLRSFAFL